MKKIKSKLLNKNGFSLVEVMLAVIILTMYIIGNTFLYYNSLNNAKENQMYAVGTNLLVKYTEYVKGQQYDDVLSKTINYNTKVNSFVIDIDVDVKQYNDLDYKDVEIIIKCNSKEIAKTHVLKYIEGVEE